jgi:asparagine synthase (glutamine-hydrolysing)
MTIDLATGAIDVERHYELRIDPSVGQLGPEEAAALYGARLEDATLLRLRADVRVGTCLSGGLDSSSVAALAAPAYEAARSEPFCAITAVSEQSSNDESGFAELVVKRLGLEWIRVRPDYSAFASTVRDVALTQEEPFDSPSVCMQYFVMRAAREADIPVLLDGQGGDETLLGYRNYFAALISSKLRSRGIASSVREYLRIRRLAAETGVSTARLLAEVALLESGALRRIRSRRRGWFLRGAPRLPEIQDRRAEATRELRQFQVLEVTEAILPTLLRYEDKNSMRHAIETRLPFLDYRSVETAISLAPESKIYRGWTKYPLRRAMDHRLPAAIAWRRTKLGFEAPADLWMRMHYGQMLAAVEDSRILGEVTEQRHRDRLFLGTTPSTRWRLFSIALWEQAFGVT